MNAEAANNNQFAPKEVHAKISAEITPEDASMLQGGDVKVCSR